MRMEQNRPSARKKNTSYSSKRKIKRKFYRNIIMLIILVLTIGILALAFIISQNNQADTTSSSMPSIVAVIPSSSSVPASSSVPERTPTPYDEDDMPYLFNYENFIPDEYTENLEMKDVGGGHQMAVRAADAFIDMQAAAKEDGVSLVPLSGYRSNERQTNNYNASIQNYISQGYSQEEAVSRTQGYYAIPGTSEHEAGLAMDIGDINAPNTNIDDSFDTTESFAWLIENCTTYGFILRYDDDTFDITHINYEPWHYRYVGANHAEIIVEHDITLEEYVEYYDEYNPSVSSASSAD